MEGPFVNILVHTYIISAFLAFLTNAEIQLKSRSYVHPAAGVWKSYSHSNGGLF